ncbi:amidohydrolase family protein [Candidatus Margulisiibacteriota bacterium]
MNIRKITVWAAVALAVVLAGARIVPAVTGLFYDYDVLIKGGKVYDGTLAAPRTEDVGIKGARIVGVGTLTGPARRLIDAKGLIVTPGFIDVHNHSDVVFNKAGLFRYLAFIKPEWKGNYNYLTQGVTTIVDGNCGWGFADLNQYFGFLDLLRFGTNVYTLAPHGDLRNYLFGKDDPEALAEDQLEALKNEVEKEMKRGALGLSTGLEYAPGCAATTAELVELAKVVKKYNGIYVSHIRDNTGDGVLKALKEAIEVGKRANIPVHISHLQVNAPRRKVKAVQLVALIKQARAEGVDITADSYPYDAGNSWITMLTPAKYKTSDSIRPEYKTGPGREELKQAVIRSFKDLGPDQVIINQYAANRSFEGKTLAEIAKGQGKSPEEMYAMLACDDDAPMCIFLDQDINIVKALMPYDHMMSASDGTVYADLVGRPHPRSFGAFTRKIRYIVLEQKLMSLPAAIRSMTSLPAEKFKLKGRGRIAVGNYADIAVIDLKNLYDKATYKDPVRYSTGVKYLLVNGVLSIADGKLTGKRGGRTGRRADPIL